MIVLSFPMEILQQLGVALGLASLAGLNLYFTVLLTGLAVRFHLVDLSSHFQSLDVLGHPLIIMVAGVLFALQFFADKIPLVDSLWDSVHTFIRPVGGTLLALGALGPMPAWLKVVAVLLAGSVTLTTHGAKAGTRLLINHSPEPVSNIGMSLVEDALVFGGVTLTFTKPIVAFVVFAIVIAVLWMIFPRLWRGIRATIWLFWHKIKLPGGQVVEAPELKKDFTDELRDMLRFGLALSEDEIIWTVRCLSGRSKGISGLVPNLHGVLAAPRGADYVCFAAVKSLRGRVFKVPLAGAQVEAESKFLSENVVINAEASRAVFCFPRGQAAVAQLVARKIREMIPVPPSVSSHAEIPEGAMNDRLQAPEPVTAQASAGETPMADV